MQRLLAQKNVTGSASPFTPAKARRPTSPWLGTSRNFTTGLAPGGSIGFAGGMLYVQWSDAAGSSNATTLGGTVQIWNGKLAALMDHELYHSRQYIYLHDWMIPMWLVGGIWGVISSAIADPSVKAKCFQAARKGQKGIGNPVEAAAYNISGGASC